MSFVLSFVLYGPINVIPLLLTTALSPIQHFLITSDAAPVAQSLLDRLPMVCLCPS
jgi:hypothetical protein